MQKVFTTIDEVINNYTGRARAVLKYSQLMAQLVLDAKKPGFSADSWAPVAQLVDVPNFQRIGPFKDAMDWDNYVAFLTGWATTSEWECSFKRITEVGNLVFLELEERSKVSGFANAVNSLSVYEFNSAGKMQHVDVYLQMEMPGMDMMPAMPNN